MVTKKTQAKEVIDDPKPTVIVKDQEGNLIQTFDSVEDGYAFASENGYQVEVN